MYVDMDGKGYLNDTQVGGIVSIEDEKAVTKESIIRVMKNSFLRVIDDYIKEFPSK